MSVTPIANRYAILCASLAAADTEPADGALAYDSLHFDIFDKSQNQHTILAYVTRDDIYNLAIDVESSRLVLFENSGFGAMQTIDLQSGSKSRRTGLFLPGLLNDL